jgi:hypothetical protein
MSPKRLCSVARCPRFARPGSSRCDNHTREMERERSTRRRGGYKRGPYEDVTKARDADPDYRHPGREA